jgi:HTH-type transcriptional regulator/antitoxin HipB
MLLRTDRDIGALIRDQRKKQKLDQAELAARIGVNRRWVIEVERGKPRAEVGLVLKALDALGLSLSVEARGTASRSSPSAIEPIDIDAVIENARRPRP